MDLNETPEMAAFRAEVRGFLEAHRDDYAQGSAHDVRAWQKLLIEHGYAARARSPGRTAAMAPSRTS